MTLRALGRAVLAGVVVEPGDVIDYDPSDGSCVVVTRVAATSSDLTALVHSGAARQDSGASIMAFEVRPVRGGLHLIR